MASENNFVQPAIPRFDGHYDHWSMLMENFLRSKEYWQVVESGVAEPAVGEMLSKESKDIDELTIDELQSSLLVHEQKLNQQDKEEQALKVSTENQSTQRGDKRQGRGKFKGRGSNYRDSQQQRHQHQENQSRGRGRGRGDLTTNLLSIGQLQEKGYEISIKDGVCQIHDAKIGNDSDMITKFKRSMMLEFDMSDLGKMHYFLGIRIVQSATGIFISQKKYAQEILDRFQMENCNSVNTPAEVGLKLVRNPEGRKVDSTLYKQIIGNLMYLTATRPDIMHAEIWFEGFYCNKPIYRLSLDRSALAAADRMRRLNHPRAYLPDGI
ncbi:hypothetical protein ZIOFF_062016 [Zingiber officinale]|uniref:Reverse transcriptase Ty1/copia-type domain-containing protein n=1 Tax=Zingiber officinale TaxID=94328 RepID=A0A8J5KIV5_ZINOF|nr:hypothetical protein ZIOFF_062016 [Zingiber officinale]